MAGKDRAQAPPKPGARQRILDVSFSLFAERGIRDVGVDELIERSGVAKATFYKYFRTKDDLVLAYLQRWYEERSAAIDEAVRRHNGSETPALLAVFDVFDEWFRQGSSEVSSFLHVLMEMGPAHPLGKASLEYLARTREQLAGIARNAKLSDPDGFAWSCHILLKGAIVAAAEGDLDAAARARHMAALLVAERRSPVHEAD
ncbi:TetR/AcrR family transcriptional regulator [Sinomonas terrae]|uniref:TetR/AcrR family transcriptional regulator n=1 Tax=Sinomonas terrae TaxID=2908838 RepID=A0ABS9U0N3_9MICC|nr:TetR/AcrR family transcriptional regulator [Sinomonas terrae]MCH6470145.1 TetR/AcrR family transcriptional regulator [Sinomonas terrae]HKU10271.1 TetR/AcrR family transcriptional regulator [Sinomonas sp.]